jgi:hypothetical protein
MADDLTRLGVNTRGKTIKELQKTAEARNIPTVVGDVDIKEQWMGKPKGMQQVLCEQGL